jgi:glycosyltransferase involved in cell wall biosynthesis
MNQKDYSILDGMNLFSSAVVINQCDIESIQCFQYRDKYEVKWINSKERGLSRSRNKAIDNSDADICLISDDDETFVDNIDKVIADAYSAIPDADVIIFRMINHKDRFPSKIYRLKKLDALKVSSCQITFKRESVKNVHFDIHLGAGTGNGAGEENNSSWIASMKGYMRIITQCQ